MEKVLEVLNLMIEEQKTKRKQLIEHINKREADLDNCYVMLKSASGSEREDLKFDIDEKQEMIDELYSDLSSINYMIRQLRSRVALMEVQKN